MLGRWAEGGGEGKAGSRWPRRDVEFGGGCGAQARDGGDPPPSGRSGFPRGHAGGKVRFCPRAGARGRAPAASPLGESAASDSRHEAGPSPEDDGTGGSPAGLRPRSAPARPTRAPRLAGAGGPGNSARSFVEIGTRIGAAAFTPATGGRNVRVAQDRPWAFLLGIHGLHPQAYSARTGGAATPQRLTAVGRGTSPGGLRPDRLRFPPPAAGRRQTGQPRSQALPRGRPELAGRRFRKAGPGRRKHGARARARGAEAASSKGDRGSKWVVGGKRQPAGAAGLRATRALGSRATRPCAGQDSLPSSAVEEGGPLAPLRELAGEEEGASALGRTRPWRISAPVADRGSGPRRWQAG